MKERKIEEFNYEEKDDKEPKNDDNEKNKLEEMYDDSASDNGDIPNYSFDEFNESELDGMLDDDVFVDSEIKPDKIDTMDDFDINDINIIEEGNSHGTIHTLSKIALPLILVLTII